MGTDLLHFALEISKVEHMEMVRQNAGTMRWCCGFTTTFFTAKYSGVLQ
jgi:hypothetical protein